jgi:transcriptional regulator with PAS, ATPase and Fis domain
MIGNSEAMHQLTERIRTASRVAGSILVMGETGSGKELVARAIHENSLRNTGRFVAVDCGALPEDLIESELFGYRRGAFTTAMTDKPGLFEIANGGTLFLDEISNTSRRFQAKLLRALQDRQIRRLGDVVARKVDIRVIAATNCDLLRLVQRGDFREDLFYRLNVFSIQVPPLRDRLDDIPLLSEFILQGRRRISAGALAKLQSYNFPGNVRELENIVESAIYSGDSDTIEDRDIVLPCDRLRVTENEIQVENFWESVARPYADRQITRHSMEHVIRKGLIQTEGSYRRLVRLFNLPESDYKRFMDFLRRHRCNVDYRQYRKRPERNSQ